MTDKHGRYINEIVAMGYRPVMRNGERVYEISRMKMLYKILVGDYAEKQREKVGQR